MARVQDGNINRRPHPLVRIHDDGIGAIPPGKQRAELFRKSAFKGEWIEVPDADGKFAWKQKE